jgi:hypothetical protein
MFIPFFNAATSITLPAQIPPLAAVSSFFIQKAININNRHQIEE